MNSLIAKLFGMSSLQVKLFVTACLGPILLNYFVSKTNAQN